MPLRHGNRFIAAMTTTHGNWIYLQCVKWGRVTFGKDSLKTIFAANDKNLSQQLKDFCHRQKVKMESDRTRTLYTFQISGKQPASVNLEV